MLCMVLPEGGDGLTCLIISGDGEALSAAAAAAVVPTPSRGSADTERSADWPSSLEETTSANSTMAMGCTRLPSCWLVGQQQRLVARARALQLVGTSPVPSNFQKQQQNRCDGMGAAPCIQ